MITTLDIEQAEQAEAKVRERAERLRRTHGMDDNGSVEQARRQAEELRDRKAAQDAALEVRAAAVKASGGELKRLAVGLDKSASSVAEAAREASEALRRLLATVEAHTGVVGAAHARLTELALPLADRACSGYEEGAGSNGVVRVGGRMYGPVPGDAVFSETVGRMAKELFGDYHQAALVVRTMPHHIVSQSAAGRELLGRLP
ncbi:hypothetical protein RB628_03645 [Streptomyces sp. ADMS]|uniref:hypothetical protein n=1 Tax=Streptomyces sp. ADMS TaxID=3071415 RepID=UPI00296E6835|nr:hypothetical protein [Streptomyces sp. ADMS]MDW4904454.1 hypothetical protein [Streptomyces sp. ADMS]